MLRYSQFLIFELGASCNLGKEHSKCPVIIRPHGKKKIDDDLIVRLATEAYTKLGFEGLIGFHFYNEPMLNYNRMLELISRIRKNISKSRFILWTNGTILVDDKRFDNFEKVFVTDYENKGKEHYKPYYRNELYVNKPSFDDRLEYESKGSSIPCERQFIEFIINAYGDVIFCCQDWQNHIKIGSVFEDSLEDLAKRKLELSTKICKFISEENETCYKCNGKIPLAYLDEKTHNNGLSYIWGVKNGLYGL